MNVHILELLASKICHDLISPIGAVNNGIEFLQDMGADALEDATDLISMSATQASAKLKAYRLVYGAGGADVTHKPSEVHDVMQEYLGEGSRVEQVWSADTLTPLTDAQGVYPKGFCKILMGLLLLAVSCLPKGGTLDVQVESASEIVVSVTGADAGLRDGVGAALSVNADSSALHPHVIHAHVCALLADCYGYVLPLPAQSPDQVRFSLSWTV